jgi:hypothetical protein
VARSPMRTGRITGVQGQVAQGQVAQGRVAQAQVARDDVILHFRDGADPGVEPFFIRVASQDGHTRAEEMMRELKTVLREGIEVRIEIVRSRFAPTD